MDSTSLDNGLLKAYQDMEKVLKSECIGDGITHNIVDFSTQDLYRNIKIRIL